MAKTFFFSEVMINNLVLIVHTAHIEMIQNEILSEVMVTAVCGCRYRQSKDRTGRDGRVGGLGHVKSVIGGEVPHAGQ